MKKKLIIESCEKIIKPHEPSSIVHIRNSCILKEKLGFDLISHESEIDSVMDKKYDNIICAYASPYMKYNNYLRILDNNPQAKMYWLMNDHDVEDNILLRKWALKNEKPYHMICNNPREGYRGWILRKNLNGKTLNDYIDEWHTINLNALIFNDKNIEKEKSGLVYYGTFRKHRIKDLLKYNGIDYFLSSSAKNHIKFTEAGVKAKMIDRLSWFDRKGDLFEYSGVHLADYKYSLYIEDEHTHENYAFMANRFYECLMNNVILFYDINCTNTIKKSGFEILSFQLVNDANDLKEKIEFLDNNKDMYLELLEFQNRNKNKVLLEQFNVLCELNKILN